MNLPWNSWLSVASDTYGFIFALIVSFIFFYKKYKSYQRRKPDNPAADIKPSLEDSLRCVPIDSIFYIDRPPLEDNCYRYVDNHNALLRIKSPKQMGKTSLMWRILQHAEQANNQTIHLDLNGIQPERYQDLASLLRWFCDNCYQPLKELKLDNLQSAKKYFLNKSATMQTTRRYFEKKLLPSIEGQLVIAIDNIDFLFPYPKVAAEFFSLLRFWYDDGSNSKTRSHKLRFILLYSDEVPETVEINKSPFNVGVPIDLPYFTREQCQALVCKHGFKWEEQQVDDIMALLGGHPYLIRQCLYDLVCLPELSLDDLIRQAPTHEGIFKEHLQRQHGRLIKYGLEKEYLAIVKASHPVSTAHQKHLLGLGLVVSDKNAVRPSCDLYRNYFQAIL